MDEKNNKLKLFGKNVGKYRRQRELSQYELAEMLNVSREHLAKIETARRGVSLKLLFKLSDILKVPESEFFNFEENK